MGAGFALYVAPADSAHAVDVARQVGLKAWITGTVETGSKQVLIEPLGLRYSAADLRVRA